LQNKVAMVNVEMLNILGIAARRSGSVIHLPNGAVGVDEACSGIRSLQSAVMATLFIGYLSLKHKSLQALLLVCGIVIAIVGNLIRSLWLSLAANAGGKSAVEEAHDPAGFAILAFTAICVGLVAWRLAKYEKWAAREENWLRSREENASPV
jgi:exosortase